MRYKVLVSDGDDAYSFYEENKEMAKLLFNMAKYSGMFTYAEISSCIDDCNLLEDWSDTE